MWKKAMIMGCAVLAAAGLTACGNEGNAKDTAAPAKAAPAADTNGAKAERGKSVVVYFSATGNTKKSAAVIAKETGSTLFEIEAAQPYSDADLNYRDNNSRCVKEHEDPSIHPAIKTDIQDWDSYQTVFLGYPIWWGEAPNIVYTFVTTHDFSGKKVIPFCTSASSGLGSSDVNLAKAAGTGDWLGGTRFSGGVNEKDLIDWSKKY